MKTIHYLKQVPKALKIIKAHYAKVPGVKEVKVAIRVADNMVAYIYIDSKAASNCTSDMILPAEAGYRFLKPALNKKKYPRLWLMEMVAEVKCKKKLAEIYPDLNIECVTLIRTGKHSIAPV